MIKVVIRSVGERSLPLCTKAIQSQTDDFTVIQVLPFIRAVEKTFEVGSGSKKKWLLAVDADVVLNNDAISRVCSEAELFLEKEPTLFKIDFGLRDKFRGAIYGCHLYKNGYSRLFYEKFSTIEHDPRITRPESTNIAEVCNVLGLKKRLAKSEPIGKHDFEQFYRHLYVKYYNRAIRDAKSYEKILTNLESKVLANPNDHDFKVALIGFVDGKGKDAMYTDAGFYPDISDRLSALGTQEKAPI